MLSAVIFDMDGVIIDSEPLWRKAELEVFSSVGLNVEERMLAQTTGLGINEAIRYWYSKMQWKGKDISQVVNEVLDHLTVLINENSVLTEGTEELIELFKKKNYKIALASSSPYRIINTVIDKFGIRDMFDVINSAEEMRFGKPHPEIYIQTAEKLDVHTQLCLAIEDSINGLIAAKAARMKCAVMPGPFHIEEKGLSLADLIINSLSEIDEQKIKVLSEL
jgi:sugar-phosphatase